MDIDSDLLRRFEEQLLPYDLSRSTIPARVLGYGEISSIFSINNREDIVYKRIPIFQSVEQAEAYTDIYHQYCNLLKEAGLLLPEDDVAIVSLPGRPVVAYFVQRRFPAELICHRLLNTLSEPEIEEMLSDILTSVGKTWQFNARRQPEFEIAVDAQLSNWVRVKENGKTSLYLLDTTTPFFRIQGLNNWTLNCFYKASPLHSPAGKAPGPGRCGKSLL